MIYQEAFELFSKESPVTVMMRGTMENVFSAQRLDRLFGETAVRQYEEELLFSTVADLMGLAVTKVRPSIHAAYQHRKERVNVSVKAVYDKLNGIEPQVCRAMVVQTADQLGQLIGAMKAGLPELLPGYRVRILDGNHLRRHPATFEGIAGDQLRPAAWTGFAGVGSGTHVGNRRIPL